MTIGRAQKLYMINMGFYLAIRSYLWSNRNNQEGVIMTRFEKRLYDIMLRFGYRCERMPSGKAKLHTTGCGFSSGRSLPYTFSSVFGAAEYLIPIISNENYRKAVHST